MRRHNFITVLWRGSIRRQLVLGFVAASLLLMAPFGYLIHAQQRDALYLSSTERATSLAHALSISSTSWVLANDLAGLQEAVQGFARTTDMRRAFFVSPQGEVLASTSPNEIGFFVTDQLSRDMLASTMRDQVVLFDQHSFSSEDLLRMADDAMYQAKQGGRNQVRFLEHQPLAKKAS